MTRGDQNSFGQQAARGVAIQSQGEAVAPFWFNPVKERLDFM